MVFTHLCRIVDCFPLYAQQYVRHTLTVHMLYTYTGYVIAVLHTTRYIQTRPENVN